ncbi:hypothetical protein ABZX77_36805 [Streptomyces sp. NPDC004237]|uniref:hypothetical protein n=1 Tax=Streptomyces sp. NPDC004237 TaxID=3154455 RepID=UPI0033B66318
MILLATGFMTSLALGLMGILPGGFEGAVVLGFSICLAFGIMLGVTPVLPVTSLGARDAIRSAVFAGLVGGLAVALMFCLTIGLSGGRMDGLAIGLSSGLTIALVGPAQAARRYGVYLLCSRRRLPFRLGLFLDWAVSAGLMRISGPAYQYRHRELQHWLRQHPQPPSVP